MHLLLPVQAFLITTRKGGPVQMDIALIGSNYFQEAFNRLGCRTFWISGHPDADLNCGFRDPHIPYLLSKTPFKPDAILLTDDLGWRILPTGLEKTSIPTAWYAVDVPINYFWQKQFAPLFDIVFSDQKLYVEKLRRHTSAMVSWLPVAVDVKRYLGGPLPPKYDIGFVGVVNPGVRPKRSLIIDGLKASYNMFTAGGRKDEWIPPERAAGLYRSSRIVLNENLFPGVTTRMFEAMASGALLLTEATDESIGDLFIPGEDLSLYGPDNLTDLIDYYLHNREIRRKTAASGRDKVIENHDVINRAETLLEILQAAKCGKSFKDSSLFDRCSAKTLFLTGMRWPRKNGIERLRMAENLFRKNQSFGQLDPESFYFSGIIAKISKRPGEAEACFEQAAQAGEIRAALALAYLRNESGRSAEASGIFRKALIHYGVDDARPGEPFFTPDHHYSAGRCLESAGFGLTPGFSKFNSDISFWSALEHYRKALQLDPAHTKTLVRMGDLLAEHDAYTEAATFYEKALRLNPNDSVIEGKYSAAAESGYFLLNPGRRKVA